MTDPKYRTDESSTINTAQSISKAKTAYFNYQGDTDYFKIDLAPGTYSISVLPDLLQTIYSADSPLGAGGVPLLMPEAVGITARIMREVTRNGVQSFDLVAELTSKKDDLALAGRTPSNGSEIVFHQSDVLIKSENRFTNFSTGQNVVETANYYLSVSGSPVPYTYDTKTFTPVYAEEGGRYLVAFGNPTGQRSTNWGNWIETYSASGSVVSTSGDSTTKDGAGNQGAPAGISYEMGLLPITFSTNGADAKTRPWHYDEASQGWSVPSLGSKSLTAYIGLGEKAFVAGAALELNDFVGDALKGFAEARGFGTLYNYGEKIKNTVSNGSELYTSMVGVVDTLQRSIKNFGTSVDNSGLDNDVFYAVARMQQNLILGLNTQGGSTAKALEMFANSISLMQSNSDVSFEFSANYNGSGKVFVAESGHRDWAVGTQGNDKFSMGNGDDFVFAGAGNDAIFAGSGNDVVYGGAGIDIALASGPSSQYNITMLNSKTSNFQMRGNNEFDQLFGVERVQFTDGKVLALDIQGNAGQVYRLYKAAFDRSPDIGGLTAHVRAVDNGVSINSDAATFLSSPEFALRYGSAPSDQAFVFAMYKNVLQRSPDAAGLSNWMTALSNNTLDRAGALAAFSDSYENHIRVDPTITMGITLDSSAGVQLSYGVLV